MLKNTPIKLSVWGVFMENKLTYKELDFPFYRNTREVFANLTVSDLVKAAVLAPVNVLLVGDTGTGKTQLARDIFNYYFGGNKAEGGQGVHIRAHPEIDIHNEIFTELKIEKARRELTESIDALIFMVDEFNRAPPVAQNQFLALGDGIMDYKGRAIRLGKEGYLFLIATANLEDGEFLGTFRADKALYNRLHVTIDFDYSMFKPTIEDHLEIDETEANPNVKEANKRDISEKIIKASKEIGERTKNIELTAKAVINYLRFGLNNCMKYGHKEKSWPMDCQECEYNKEQNEHALCSLIKAPVRRTQNAMVRFAAAMAYIAKLKNPKIRIDTVDLIFKAFELTGAYQQLLNPFVLKNDYKDQNPKMMAEVIESLKDDFRKNEDYIIASLQAAEKGELVTVFFEHNGQLGNYQKLTKEAKREVQKIDVLNDDHEVGLSWVEEVAKLIIKKNKQKHK